MRKEMAGVGVCGMYYVGAANRSTRGIHSPATGGVRTIVRNGSYRGNGCAGVNIEGEVGSLPPSNVVELRHQFEGPEVTPWEAVGGIRSSIDLGRKFYERRGNH